MSRRTRHVPGIRTRLILMSASIILLLLVSLSASLFLTFRIASIYDTMADYQLLASRIYLQLSDTAAVLEDYLETKDPAYLDSFNKTYPGLLRDAIEYEEIARDDDQRRTVIDFRYMVQTYIESANAAVAFSREDRLPESNQAFFEARRVQSLINSYLPKIFDVQTSDVRRIDHMGRVALRRSLFISGIITALIILISIIVTSQVIPSIAHPVSKLVSVAGSVAVGEWDARVEPIDERTEMRILGTAFNGMLDKIQEQMGEIQAARERDKERFNETLDAHRTESLLKIAQLKTLQARINPHFLFNTLNIITQSAYMENSSKTAEITEAFASLMRFNLEHFDGEVTLEEEFENLNDYLFLQRIRFGERITIRLELDDAVRNERLPGLVLQPLVENSISHGMSDIVDGGCIDVTAKLFGDHYTLTVSDNGLGMSADSLNKARRYAEGDFPESYGSHIGVRNVFERLYLYSDGMADIMVDSVRGKGTDISMSMPLGGIE